MSISRKKLVELLKSTHFSVYRDKAPVGEKLPYIIYSFVSEPSKRASGKIYRRTPLYQISLFTEGVEQDFSEITYVLNLNGINFSSVQSIQGDENDDTITNYFTQVRCVEND